MRSVSSTIYDKNYYLSECLGSQEFLESNGRMLHPRVEKLVSMMPLKKSFVVLDIGCGRGDLCIYLSNRVKKITGIDYAKEGIEIANSLLTKRPLSVQKKVDFMVMNAKKLKFPDNTFDMIISIDVFEHLYKEELEVAMREIKRVLKPGGILFVDTNTNKWLYDYTYRFYSRPINLILTNIDKLLKGVDYPSFPADPRIPVEKKQHVNEPTYFYLRDLFRRYTFDAKISFEIGYLKHVKSFKSYLYNFLLTLYPFSQHLPLSLFFSWSFICIAKNIKTK